MGLSGTSADFTVIYNDLKRTVSLESVTQSAGNITGSESLAYAAATNTDMIFLKRDKRYLLDKEGLLEAGDFYVMVPTTVGIKRYDRLSITNDMGATETFMVQQVIRRYFNGNTMFDFATGMKTD